MLFSRICGEFYNLHCIFYYITQACKFEEVYWRIYTIKCNLVDLVNKKRGEPVPFFWVRFLCSHGTVCYATIQLSSRDAARYCLHAQGKMINGVLLFCGIVVLLIGPLLLFSSFNYESPNLVQSMQISLSVRGPANMHTLFVSNELALVPFFLYFSLFRPFGLYLYCHICRLLGLSFYLLVCPFH